MWEPMKPAPPVTKILMWLFQRCSRLTPFAPHLAGGPAVTRCQTKTGRSLLSMPVRFVYRDQVSLDSSRRVSSAVSATRGTYRDTVLSSGPAARVEVGILRVESQAVHWQRCWEYASGRTSWYAAALHRLPQSPEG